MDIKLYIIKAITYRCALSRSILCRRYNMFGMCPAAILTERVY